MIILITISELGGTSDADNGGGRIDVKKQIQSADYEEGKGKREGKKKGKRRRDEVRQSRSARRSEGDGQPNEGRKFSGTVHSGHG